jgi:hypothetical protein
VRGFKWGEYHGKKPNSVFNEVLFLWLLGY